MRWLALPWLLLAIPALAESGLSAQQAFASCQACHSLEPGGANKLGPHLHRLAGRQAGSLPGYDYSAALQASGIRWDRGNLVAWITATEGMVPGTFMVYHNPLTAEEVLRLVDYLLAAGQER